jgi:L-fuconolactonase
VVVDAHHHFWDPTRHDYPWMGDELAAIRRPYLPEDLAPLLTANGVDRTVLVQTISSVEETREFLGMAANNDFIAGVVGWVDLTDASAGQALAELRAGTGGEFLSGIRHQVHDEADPAWLLRDDVLRGIEAVGRAGLVYDFLVRTRELPAALHVAQRFPEIRFVIDHLAKPRIAAGARDVAWEEAMVPLAGCANVSCKLSGLVTEASWTEWTPEDFEPYVRRALDWFGQERCLFGSDWPVCLLAASYGRVLDVLRYALRNLDPAAREAVMGGNAVRIYRLDV